MGGSDLVRLFTTHMPMVRWSVGATEVVACAQAVKVTIDTDGAILVMGMKDEIRGGQGFHDVVVTTGGGRT